MERTEQKALMMSQTQPLQTNILPDDGTILPLMEEFYTIQGEGFHSGKAAYFIRLGGCDVGCHWCDVKESWDATLHPPTPVDKIILNASAVPAKAVVVTGGEPAMYPLHYLTNEFKKLGISTFLETSGAYPITGTWDWVCLSPKKTSAPLAECLEKANELKVIVHNANDLEWGEKYAKQVPKECKLFLQPEWSKAEKMMPVIVDYVMKHPEWNVSLQTHKYMHIP
jgi:7-carboxy-7-deazaguanine synthase